MKFKLKMKNHNTGEVDYGVKDISEQFDKVVMWEGIANTLNDHFPQHTFSLEVVAEDNSA